MSNPGRPGANGREQAMGRSQGEGWEEGGSFFSLIFSVKH